MMRFDLELLRLLERSWCRRKLKRAVMPTVDWIEWYKCSRRFRYCQ